MKLGHDACHFNGGDWVYFERFGAVTVRTVGCLSAALMLEYQKSVS
jgi:hypothetical protein